jgi:hypothetical protein
MNLFHPQLVATTVCYPLNVVQSCRGRPSFDGQRVQVELHVVPVGSAESPHHCCIQAVNIEVDVGVLGKGGLNGALAKVLSKLVLEHPACVRQLRCFHHGEENWQDFRQVDRLDDMAWIGGIGSVDEACQQNSALHN